MKWRMLRVVLVRFPSSFTGGGLYGERHRKLIPRKDKDTHVLKIARMNVPSGSLHSLLSR